MNRKANDGNLKAAVPIGGMSTESRATRYVTLNIPMDNSPLSVGLTFYPCSIEACEDVTYARIERLECEPLQWDHPRASLPGFGYWRAVVKYYEFCWQDTREPSLKLSRWACFPPGCLSGETSSIARTWMLGTIGLAYSYRQNVYHRRRFSKKALFKARSMCAPDGKSQLRNPLVLQVPAIGTQRSWRLLNEIEQNVGTQLAPHLMTNEWEDDYQEFESGLFESVRHILITKGTEAEQYEAINRLLERRRKKPKGEKDKMQLRILQAACDAAFMDMMQYLAGEIFRSPEVVNLLEDVSLEVNRFLYACHDALGGTSILYHPAGSLLLGSSTAMGAIAGYAGNRSDKLAAGAVSDLILQALVVYRLLEGEEQENRKDRNSVELNERCPPDHSVGKERDYTALRAAIASSVAAKIAAAKIMDGKSDDEVAEEFCVAGDDVPALCEQGLAELRAKRTAIRPDV